MAVKKPIPNLFLLMLLAFLITWGGPLMSGFFSKKRREMIDKNGLVIPALVSEKKQSKGHFVYYTYDYLDHAYSSREMSSDYYQQLSVGESIEIKVDTTDPEESYIFATRISR